uniref:Zinc finger protein 541 n=1 Tax=Sphenodon punctatus TaxID=8508 RepID=A0A8D0GBB3_SPHPU
MEHYHLSDENSLPSELHLPEFPDSQGLNCSDTLNHDLCPDTRDMIYTGLRSLDMDPSLSTTDLSNDTLEDNLDTLSLYSVKDCDSVKLLDECDSDSQTGLRELVLPVPAVPKEADHGGRSNSGSTRKGKHQHSSPQASFLDCSLCGKVFTSASSLSKHYLTHSQERKHICKICSKAFKRQDHLSGHMLTHQKTKPFMCVEQGCNKSYCDHRSLRRHYEMQHGLCVVKDEEACEGLLPSHDSHVHTGAGSVRTVERLSVHSDSKSPNNSVLPNRDLLRCIVTSMVNQKLQSTPASSSGQSEVDTKGSLQFCSSTSVQVPNIPFSTTARIEATGEDVPKECYPCQNSAVSSSVYSQINPGNLPVIIPSGNATDLTDKSLLSESQVPLESTAVEYWSNSPCFPLFRGQKISTNSHPSSSNIQWVRNVPICTKRKGNDVYVAHKPSVTAQDNSEGLGRSTYFFDSFAQTCEPPDTLPFTSPLLKTQGDVSGEAKLSNLEKTFRPAKRQEYDFDSYQRLNRGELSVSDAQKQSDTGPIFKKFFMKSQETSVNQEQMKVQQRVFQMLTKSQHILSHSQLMAPLQLAIPETAAKPLQNVSHQQQQHVDLVSPVQESTEPEESPLCAKRTVTQRQKNVSSSSEKRGQQTAATLQRFQPRSEPCVPDAISFAKQTQPLKGGLGFKDISSVSQLQPAACENALGNHTYGKSSQLVSKKREKTKGWSKETGGKLHSGSGRPRRKEKLKFDLPCTASPSQVAMASFSLPSTSADQVAGARPKLTIFNRIQGGNIYSLANAVREDNLSAGCNKTRDGPADGNEHGIGFVCKNCSQLFYTERCLNSHVCFQSEQWQSPQLKKEEKVVGSGSWICVLSLLICPHLCSLPLSSEGQDEEDRQASVPQKKRKRRTRPKSLFIPPPPPLCGEMQPGMGGCYQSNLRSPVYLVDHLLQGFFQQHSPYTPPPMLSPIREGSGLYFNTLYSSAIHSSLLFCYFRHINVGSRFQAEIPSLQDRSSLESNEHAASLVWKPWGDIATNQETAMPGGGTNLELALHCLHDTQGNILEALEMLLLRDPKKPPSHPLADYHYSGSDVWTPVEKQLFKKAFCLHKKDFYLIQKKIQTKNVFQCVEYYYIWKKIIKFDCSRSQVVEKRVKREQDEVEMTEEKTAYSPKKRYNHLPKQDTKIKSKNYKKVAQNPNNPASSRKEVPGQPGNTESQATFPCRECERVFDKIKSRNAHMKRHRLQEQMEPLIKIKWPIKHIKKEPPKEETSSAGDDLQG